MATRGFELLLYKVEVEGMARTRFYILSETGVVVPWPAANKPLSKEHLKGSHTGLAGWPQADATPWQKTGSEKRE